MYRSALPTLVRGVTYGLPTPRLSYIASYSQLQCLNKSATTTSPSNIITSILLAKGNERAYCTSTTGTNTDQHDNTKLTSKERNILKKKKKREEAMIQSATTNNINNNSTSPNQDSNGEMMVTSSGNPEIDRMILDINNSKIEVQMERCTGCGCMMQHTDDTKLGYVPKSIAIKYMLNRRIEEDIIQEEAELTGLSKDHIREIMKQTKLQQRDMQREEQLEEGDDEHGLIDVKEINEDEENNDYGFDIDNMGEEEVEDDQVNEIVNKKEEKNLSIDEIEREGERQFDNFIKSNELGKSYSVSGKKEQMDHICQRCHMLKNYGRVVPIKIPVEDFKSKLAAIKDMNCVVVKVVDIMDFNGTFVQNFRSIIGNNPVIVVCNKMDVLPADIHKHRIEDWIRRECKLRGMVAAHVKLLSSTSREGISDFIVELERIRRGRDVFVIGCSNVGKSTFLNSLVDEYSNKVVFRDADGNEMDDKQQSEKRQMLASKATTSIFPGTTLNVISVPLWNDSTLFDTPGVDNPFQIIKLLRPEELKMVIPTKRIRPSIAHVIEGKSLYLGGLIRIDYIGGLATFTVYASNYLPVHLCRTDKAEALLERQRGRLLRPPHIMNPDEPLDDKYKLTRTKRFTIAPESTDFKHSHIDLVISGLGWVSIKPLSRNPKPFKLIVHSPDHIDITLRDPLVPFTNTYNIIK